MRRRVPVERTPDIVAGESASAHQHDLGCIALAGSAVITGSAEAVVSPLWLLALPLGIVLFLTLDKVRRRFTERHGADDI
jgi:hypothetical protein